MMMTGVRSGWPEGTSYLCLIENGPAQLSTYSLLDPFLNTYTAMGGRHMPNALDSH